MIRAVPGSWSTSKGTFKTKMVGDVERSFVEYSDSKRVHLCPDIIENLQGGMPVLDFKEKTITIDEILLPMRNIDNLQLKPSNSRALK